MDAITTLDMEADVPDAANPERHWLDHTDVRGMAALRLDLHWASAVARHTDSLHAGRVNLWRDLLPPELEAEVVGRPVGHQASHSFGPGGLIPAPSPGLNLRLRPSQFNRRFTGRSRIEPRVGRFYPRGILEGVSGVFSADRQACRVLEAADDALAVDLNHPLAGIPLRLDLTIAAAWTQSDQRGGRCNEIAELVTAGGPGCRPAGAQSRPISGPTVPSTARTRGRTLSSMPSRGWWITSTARPLRRSPASMGA